MLRQLWKSVFEHTTIPDYARCPPSPTPSMRAILEADAGDTLSRVKKTLDISLPQLLNICRAFSTDLDNAVLGRPSPLDARPSQLPRLPTGNETGTYLAMDLDDDMVYVGCVTFFGSGLYEVEQVRHVIPEKIKDSDADTFFNFLADVVMEALREAGGLFLSSMHLGVTWNFRPE
jgi:hexokinase